MVRDRFIDMTRALALLMALLAAGCLQPAVKQAATVAAPVAMMPPPRPVEEHHHFDQTLSAYVLGPRGSGLGGYKGIGATFEEFYSNATTRVAIHLAWTATTLSPDVTFLVRTPNGTAHRFDGNRTGSSAVGDALFAREAAGRWRVGIEAYGAGAELKWNADWTGTR